MFCTTISFLLKRNKNEKNNSLIGDKQNEFQGKKLVEHISLIINVIINALFGNIILLLGTLVTL